MSADEAAALQRGMEALAPRLLDGATGIESLQRLSGGASQESWRFVVARENGAQQTFVLRRAATGAAERSTGNPALADEARLVAAAAAAGVPVPPLVAVLDPALGLGDGYVTRHVAGETLGRRIVADAALAAARRVLARQCGAALGRIHRIDTAGLPPLRRGAARAELATWAARHRGHGRRKPVFELALRWLHDQAPDDPPCLSLVHGDFRNGNLIVAPDGLAAVLDWELAHVGDPMEDLGWLCVNSWRYGVPDKPVGGFGALDDLFAGYAEAGGTVDAASLRFWQVFGTLRWGVICESMAASFCSGAERNVERAAVGRRASEAEIDLLELLAPQRAAA